MRRNALVCWSVRGAVGLLLAALIVVPASAGGGNGDANSQVFAPASKPYGHSYGQWSAAWYQWSYSLPVDQHPLFDAPGTDGSEGQVGNVWFLGGTFLSTEVAPGMYLGEADRTITVPKGTSLFFPIVNAAAAELEGDGNTEEALQARADFFADLIVPNSLHLTIDGKDVTDLADFRVESPLFTVGPLPENNISASFGYDVPEGSTGYMLSDGYYVMLKALPVGKHTIEFGGVVDASDVEGFGFIFKLHVTYTVHVVR
jgi:hypothetical protein